jgi:hypothetical protein
MAGLGGKNWTFQEEVSSSDVNGYLADQVVMRFGGTAARDAGFGGSGEPTLAEGMVSYLDDANRVDFYDGSAWTPVSKVLQVVSTAKTDTFSTTSTSFVDVTGLSVAITPSSTSSKILIMAHVGLGISATTTTAVYLQLAGGNSGTYIGNAASNRIRAAATVRNEFGIYESQQAIIPQTIVYLDSPATTSATTYKIQARISSGNTCFINQSGVDTDNSTYGRTASSITVMEISA